MRFDDLARRAGEDVRARARSGPAQEFDVWHRARKRQAAVTISGFALLLLLGIALGSAITEDETDLAIDTTLPPEVSTTTTEATPTATSITETPADGSRSILGAGWEELDYGPLTGGRYRMAAAWTGEHLFVFGGHLLQSDSVPPSSEFLQDGYVYDPDTSEWTATGAPPLGQCHLGLTRAIAVDGGVIVHGSVSVGGLECPRAARYDIDSGTWVPIESEVFQNISSRSPLARTGSLLVAPGAGLAYDLASGDTIEIPRLPAEAAGSPPGRAAAHWTGSEVIVIGPGPAFAWAPGEADWRPIDNPPIPVIGRDSVMASPGLLAVNYDMAAAFYIDDQWIRPGDLPLRFYECLPEAVSAGGTPVVRTCSGIALWDEVWGHWVPAPLEDLTGSDPGTLVGGNDALFSVGRSLRTFEIERAGDGSLELPPSIPIGVMQLDVPGGWDHIASVAPEQDPNGTIPDDATIGVAFARSDETNCLVTSTDGEPNRLETLTVKEPIAVHRPGRTTLHGTAWLDEVMGAIVLVFPDDNGSDTVVVECNGPDEAVLSDAAVEFASGLWSPWERRTSGLMEGASLLVTPRVGSSGTTVTLEARDFPVGWSEWWLVDQQGNAIAEIPSDSFPHDNPDFTLTVAIDRSSSATGITVQIPPGTYLFAVDGQVIPDAIFTKPEPAHPPLEVNFLSHPFGGIYEIAIENVGDGRVYLSDWYLRDEIPGGTELRIPATLGPDRQVFIEGGETLWIRIVQSSGCDPGELLEHARFTLEYCAEPPAASAQGDSLALYTAGDELVDRVIVGRPCDSASDDPYCGFATFHDDRYGVTFRVPDDAGPPSDVDRWHMAETTLTPALISPREILSLGTYPLRPGGEDCAQMPEHALEDLGPLDAFVSVQRSLFRAHEGFLPRPAEFTYEWLDDQAGAGFWECLDRPDRDELYLRFASFVDGDRRYIVIVGLGQDAFGTVRAQQVLDILNGLEFDE